MQFIPYVTDFTITKSRISRVTPKPDLWDNLFLMGRGACSAGFRSWGFRRWAVLSCYPVL